MNFKEKKWNPNGWYYDEEKKKWIPPDYKYMKDGKFSPVYEAEHGAKSPTGWTYDSDIMKWNPPKELIEENKQRWRWDPEKRIWIDLKKRTQEENLVYNEQIRMWVSKDQCDPEENRRRIEENRQNWKAFQKREAEREAENRRKQAVFDRKCKPAQLTEEEKELAKRIRVEHKEPTYEEWKAAKEAEKHQDK